MHTLKDLTYIVFQKNQHGSMPSPKTQKLVPLLNTQAKITKSSFGVILPMYREKTMQRLTLIGKTFTEKMQQAVFPS